MGSACVVLSTAVGGPYAAEPNIAWLGLAPDRVVTLTAAPFCVPSDALPRTTVGVVLSA
jgi:hypothetical protein